MDLGIILIVIGLVALVALLTWITRWSVKTNIVICGVVLLAAQRALALPALANKLVLHLPFDASLAIYLLFFLLPTLACVSLLMASKHFTTVSDQTKLRERIAAQNHHSAGEIMSAKPVPPGVSVILLCGLGVGFCAGLFQVIFTLLFGPKFVPLAQGSAIVMSVLFVLPTLYIVTRSALKTSSTTFFFAKDWLFCCSPSGIIEKHALKDARLVPIGRGHSTLVIGKGKPQMFEFQLDHQQSEKLEGWIQELKE